MSIVKMKRIRLIALESDKEALLSGLLHGGCVEVNEPVLDEASQAALLRRSPSAIAEARGRQSELKLAIDTLNRYAPQKGGGLTAPRDRLGERELMRPEALEEASALARTVNDHAKAIGACSARETRLSAEELALQPWQSFELPLETQGTRTVMLLLGTVPNTADFHAMAGALSESGAAAEVTRLSADKEQQYLEVLCHRDSEAKALEVLRSYGFAYAQLKELTGTVSENLHRLGAEKSAAVKEREGELAALKELGPRKKELQIALDRVEQVIAKESAKENLLTAGNILYLDGWVPAPEEEKLKGLLAKYDCAYELTDPAPEEYPEVPVKLKNSKLVQPINAVLDMYVPPVYDGIDPNPLMAPFFVTFFGLMMADMGYGLIMLIMAWFMFKKMHARGTMRNFAGLLVLCGVSTLVFGALTGGFFGDFIPQIAKIINPSSTVELPALFTPLNDTLAILIGSLVLGVIQIFTGMIINVVYKIRHGDFIDALFDEITWWVIIAGGVLAGLGIGSIAGVPVVLIIGVLMLAVGGTREAKGFGKVTSLIGKVYNGVSGYFSDTLSYARLMALMLAGSVVAQVFNTLGAVTGNVLGFVIISMIGNALNLALNLLGCYVHDLRLQCLEFFNRFYKEGHRSFHPLSIQTKYVDIIEEEQ
jgi:V/A-type H+-transporting ATPase subunit I